MRLEVITLALALLASGCVSQTSDSPEASGQDSTVVLTDRGFQPSTITIQKGETVTWKDSSSGRMWVASNRHPTHTQYSGTSLSEHCGSSSKAFDQCSTGESFSFTFAKTGIWYYHNHENPGQTGKVVVK